jgi:NTP pyrophosphatase (non-canonical NTP hydrolase)
MDKKIKLLVFNTAWEMWGEEAQLKMSIEECAELIVAIAKLGRNKNGSTMSNVAEEIADVELCLEQIKLMKGLSEQVDSYKELKLSRLQCLLLNEEDKDA